MANFFSRLKRFDALHRWGRSVPALALPLRLASYGAYRGLELLLGGRHPHGRVVAQARELVRRGSPAPDGRGPRVLFFTVRGWFVHVGGEAVLAKALEMRGARPVFFLCGGRLPQCDFKPGTDPQVTAPLCWRCTGFADRLLAAFELPSLRLRDFAGRDAVQRAHERLAGLGQEELLAYRENDLPLGQLVRPSVQRSMLRGDIGDAPASLAVLRGFVASASVMAEVADKLLDRVAPDVVVMTNGLFFAERIMLELAKRRGVEVVTYERGIRVGSAVFDRNRPVIDFHLDPWWRQLGDRPLTAEESRRLDDYLTERAGGRVGVIDLWPQLDSDFGAIADRFDLDRERPLAVLYTNILWDSAVFGRDIAFEGMFDWVVEAVRLFAARPEAQLVVRVHPSEVRIPLSESQDRLDERLARAFPRLPDNVRLIAPEDPASSYALLAHARAVLVYTSTIGLEAACAGRPVIVAGRTHYRGRGFTFDVEQRADLAPLIDRALAAGDPVPETVERARRFAHLFFFVFNRSFPWITDTPRSERRLEVTDLASLAPGMDSEMDRLCRAILGEEPFVPVR